MNVVTHHEIISRVRLKDPTCKYGLMATVTRVGVNSLVEKR